MNLLIVLWLLMVAVCELPCAHTAVNIRALRIHQNACHIFKAAQAIRDQQAVTGESAFDKRKRKKRRIDEGLGPQPSTSSPEVRYSPVFLWVFSLTDTARFPQYRTSTSICRQLIQFQAHHASCPQLQQTQHLHLSPNLQLQGGPSERNGRLGSCYNNSQSQHYRSSQIPPQIQSLLRSRSLLLRLGYGMLFARPSTASASTANIRLCLATIPTKSLRWKKCQTFRQALDPIRPRYQRI